MLSSHAGQCGLLCDEFCRPAKRQAPMTRTRRSSASMPDPSGWISPAPVVPDPIRRQVYSCQRTEWGW